MSKNVKPEIVGKLLQKKDETVVTWKIPNFTKKLSDPRGTSYDSTTFAFADTCWCLSIYPSGDSRKDSENYTGLYLWLKGKHSCKISFTLSIKNSYGAAEFSINHEYNFESSEQCAAGNNQLCKKSILRYRKSELLPNDTLTVECKLKRDNSVLVGVSRMERLLNLQKDLKKILTEKESCDVVLKLDDEEIQAHKVILENRCKVFESMFSHDMVERKTGKITIDDIDTDVFQEVLAYMYCGEVDNLSTENMCQLYVAADKYHLDELKKLCAVFIAENLSVDLFCDVLAIPDTCIDAELMLNLKEFFCKNFMSIIHTEEWKNFNEENKEITNKLLLSTLKANSKKRKYF